MLESVSSPSLHIAMDANMAAFWFAYGRAHGCTLQQAGDTAWFYTGVPHPLFNGVPRAVLDEKHVQAVIDGLQASINKEGAPAFWWLGPNTQPADLGKTLENNGLEAVGEVPGMALELQELDDALPVIANFSVEKVSNKTQQALWARVAAIGTEFPESAVEAMERIEATIDDPAYRAQQRYIGYLDGKPVASAALVLESGVAGVYAIATIPEARKQGIGKYMTLLPLLEAKQQGYRVAILQASSMGYPIYQKLGFNDVCSYHLYRQFRH